MLHACHHIHATYSFAQVGGCLHNMRHIALSAQYVCDGIESMGQGLELCLKGSKASVNINVSV